MRNILYVAVLSRIFFHIFAIVVDIAVHDYDTSETESESPAGTGTLCFITRPWVRWDAVYFVHIAEAGYEYEQMHAFYPGLPLFVRTLHGVLATAGILDKSHCSTVLSALLVNFASFLLCTAVLFSLSVHVLKDHVQAKLALILWLVSPATPFFLGL